jgi:hypothetical protein
VKAKERRKLEKRRRRIAKRLDRKNMPKGDGPVFRTSNVKYEVSEKVTAVRAGGVAAAHVLAKNVGLVEAIDRALGLLKVHQPYHESDHVLNIAYVMMAGGTKLEDLELLREDEAYMDLLGAPRIPDPTTAGDFLRRFSALDVIALMDAVNGIRVELWKQQQAEFLRRAIIDADGTISPTEGEKKLGMGMSYKGIWGYHPLLVSLANTREPLFIVNRSGNASSQDDAAQWIDRAVELTRRSFDEVLVRGDTAFSLTENFDRWTEDDVRFVFGYDAYENLQRTADSLPSAAWRPLARRPRYEVRTRERDKRENTKDEIVRENGYTNIRLASEHLAEFAYRPTKCSRDYRMIVLRKNLTVEKGEIHLFDDIRYFFYVTNDPRMTPEEVVGHANARCDQENLIEQLKNGVNALRVPVYDLVSNWAYMVIASLAWTLKAWMGLVQPRESDRDDLLRMKFKKFLNGMMLVPCQVVRGARRVLVRVLAYTDLVRLLFETISAARRLRKVGVP